MKYTLRLIIKDLSVKNIVDIVECLTGEDLLDIQEDKDEAYIDLQL